jgi:hypothetical protein
MSVHSENRTKSIKTLRGQNAGKLNFKVDGTVTGEWRQLHSGELHNWY